MDSVKILTELTAATGVSGNETGVAGAVREHFKKFTDTVFTDRLGNVFAKVGEGGPVVLICAHMDEIGMMVDGIEENGMLRICSVAGVDPRVLPGSMVVVHAREGKLRGAVGALPPHLLGPDREATSAYKISDLLVDTGLPASEVKAQVSIGDFVTFDQLPPVQLRNRRIAGKSFDDRALVVCELLAMEKLAKRKLACTAIFCATVQEERGSFGALTAAYGIDPDLAIAMDVTHAPTPGADSLDTTELGKLALTTGGNIHPKVYAQLTAIADEHNLAYAPEASIGHTGTDAWEIQTRRGGIPTGLISLPLRYMHTSVETIDLKTLENCAKLITEFLCAQGPDWEEKLCLDD
jgi:endoglucanase